ncbi:MAG: hypothetical protein AB7F38_00255 [Piscinibacter sp.]
MLLILWILAAAGCDQQAMLEKFVPQEEAAIAKEVIGKLAERNFDAAERSLADHLRTPDVQSKLAELARVLPEVKPKSVRTIGAHTMKTDSHTTYNLTFEYEFPESWVLANVVLERRGQNLVVQGLHLTPNKQSLETVNRFTFEGKGLLHYVVLALALLIPVVVIYAFVLCVRTKLPKRKWLWLVFIAVGIVQFQFNWTDGAWAVQPISFAFLGAGFFRAGPSAPYIFTLAFPLGALLFLLKRQAQPRTADA